MTTKSLTWGSAIPHLKAVAAWTQYPSKKKTLTPGKAYKVRKPVTSSATSKMKNMAASCQACTGK